MHSTGHAEISKKLEPYGIGVATGEHCQNRVIFKQFLQAKGLQFCQIDSCRMGGLNEVLSVLLMAAKFGGTGVLCFFIVRTGHGNPEKSWISNLVKSTPGNPGK